MFPDQNRSSRNGPDCNGKHHAPETKHKLTETRPRQKLPKIGDEGRNNQQACSCERRYERAQYAHGDCGQPHSCQAFDKAGTEERYRNRQDQG